MSIADYLDKVICSDALELCAGLPSASVDMIFTDPPYGHKNNDGDLIHNREVALGKGPRQAARPIQNDGIEANELFKDCLQEYYRLLKPSGVLCICCAGGGPDPQFARWSLWLDEVLTFKQMIIWDKGPMGMGWHYRRSYETVLVAHKGPSCNWYDESQKIENIIRPNIGIPKIIPSAAQHPTEKPISLPAHFIRLHSQIGDVVLDPFCGHGSTLLAAKFLGRHFIGCDSDPEWASKANRRLQNADPYKSSEVAEGIRQHSLFE